MKITLKRLSLAIASVGMLTIYGCGGGGGSDPLPTSTSVTVTPSLGKFSVGTVVNIKKALDDTVLSTGTITGNGSVTLSLAGYTGPIVVEVLGGANVTYFDEKLDTTTNKGTWQPFASTSTLRAVVPTTTGLAEVGVTALTNAAAEAIKDPVTGFKNATTGSIGDANAKIAAVYGLSDILIAPVPVDDKTVTKLNVATPSNNYALILATLAKTAPDGKFAANVAIALASDLKDGKPDGKDSTGAVIPNAPLPATLIAKYTESANEMADDSGKAFVATSPLVVNPDVNNIIGPVTQSGVTLAKAMFAELRSTLNSFANGNKTGFLDTQATRMNTDLSANVTPEMSKVAGRISALGNAMTAFEDAKAYTSSNTLGFASGFAPGTSTPALVRSSGSLTSVWNGSGSYAFCWTDSTTPSAISKVSCTHAGSDSADQANKKIKTVVFELTGTATNQYDYKATRYNKAVTVDISGQPTAFAVGTLVSSDTAGNPMPVGIGKVAKTVSGTTMTGLTLTGTLPPSASTAPGTLLATGADTIAISAARTLLTGNNYRYALSGSVSTSKLTALHVEDPTKVVTVSLDAGSYIDLDETTVATTGAKPVAAKLVGTAQTVATKFTGSVDIGSFVTDADSLNYSPTSVVFTGSISDTSTGGSGQILTGKLEAAVASYNLYHSTLPESANNYKKATVTFTGTVQAPSRPALKLVVAVAKTGLTTNSVTLNYSYDTKSIIGSGVLDSANSTSNSMTLSNQDGIQMVTKTGAVTKSGASLATILNGSVSYVDGAVESLM